MGKQSVKIMKYFSLIIVILVIVIAIMGYKLREQNHDKGFYFQEYNSISHKYDSVTSDIMSRNNFVQDSLTERIKVRQTEENTVKTAIKHNDNEYTKKIRSVDTLGLDSSIKLRAVLRTRFRRTYGY